MNAVHDQAKNRCTIAGEEAYKEEPRIGRIVSNRLGLFHFAVK